MVRSPVIRSQTPAGSVPSGIPRPDTEARPAFRGGRTRNIPRTLKWLGVLAIVLAPAILCSATVAQQKKIKVIADQDSAGPQGTNLLSLLMLLRAKQVDLLGITTVSGDQWVEPATVFALWATEQAGRTDVPVIKGAEMPLLNTSREQVLRQQMYGLSVTWHRAFNPMRQIPAGRGLLQEVSPR